jgi:acylphosphatase
MLRQGCDRLAVNCKLCLVTGRVQGVFYRASAARRAQELGVSGYARNLAGGQVEVLACGAPEAVEALIQWLWIGPSASKVSAVDVREASIDAVSVPREFTIA